MTGTGKVQRTEDEEINLRGRTIAWAGIVTDSDTGDAAFVLRFTDGSNATVGAWQREGYPAEVSVTIDPD